MTRATKHHSKIESKNSLDVMTKHYRADDTEKRGHKDGMEDPQKCELPPHDLKEQELQDCWTRGYRRAWAEREAAQ
jgi:hypothetical protein